MKTFEPVSYSVNRVGTTISLKKNKEELASIFVDATDNRLTFISIDKDTPLEAIKVLTEYLDNNFGAKQIFIIPGELKEKFLTCGFRTVDPKTYKDDRLRNTSFKVLAGIKSEEFKNLEFIQDEAVRTTSKENIKKLAQGSNFLKTKIEQYEEQGYPGFQLMCDYSIPFGLKDKTSDKLLVAYCRVTDLGNGNYYLGDTFVEGENKEKITACLYQKVGEYFLEKCGSQNVYLIAPPGREEEFENDYGCQVPQNVVIKFRGPQSELKKVLEEEKSRIEQKLLPQENHKTQFAP